MIRNCKEFMNFKSKSNPLLVQEKTGYTKPYLNTFDFLYMNK